MKMIKTIYQFCISRYLALSLWLWGGMQSLAVAAGPNPDNLPTVKFDTLDTNERDFSTIGWTIGRWTLIAVIVGLTVLTYITVINGLRVIWGKAANDEIRGGVTTFIIFLALGIVLLVVVSVLAAMGVAALATA